MYWVMVSWSARAIRPVFHGWLLPSGQHGSFGSLLFHMGRNSPCWVSGAAETSLPTMELPPFPPLECCRIVLLRLVAFAGLILVFQLAAKAPRTSCPQLLLINLSFDNGLEREPELRGEKQWVLRLGSLILFRSVFFPRTLFLLLCLWVGVVVLISAQI